jgi:hypothetical protein
MNVPARIDFSEISVVDVARELLGQESPERSTSTKKHFPDHAGLFVNVIKNRWYSHGNQTGGDAVSLVRFATNCDFGAAVSWLRQRNYIAQPSSPSRRVVETYDYVDADGVVAYHVDRYVPKDFRPWREIDGERVNGLAAGLYERSRSNGQWYRAKGEPRLGAVVHSFPAVTALPYRLPELLQSGGAPVLVPGGEKDADNLRALGFTATCNHGGEGKWWNELTRWFKGRRVFLLVDNDKAGEVHQSVVGLALNGVAKEIKVVRFPNLPEGGDVSDVIDLKRNEGLDDRAIYKELVERFHKAPPWETVPKIETPGGDGWPEPVSLPEGLSPVAALDTALLPSAIEPWVCDISERMQCPPDYIGVASLTALGAALGLKIGIAPEQQTDWFEVPNNWSCIVGRPGDMKSPAIGEALKPLHRLEVRAREVFDAESAEYDKSWQLWKLRKDAAEAKTKSDLKKNPNATIQFDAAEPQEPTERRYVTNDTSYEKLGEILAQNPNGVLAHRDELVSLLKTLDREEFAAARGFFLTAWNGKDRYTFDRIMRGKTHIEAACVSLLGSTQPGRLAEYVRRAVSGGAGDDGLIQRFGLLVWPDQSPEWKSVDRYPNSAARDAAWECFVSFDNLDPGAIGAEPTSPFQTVPVLRFDAEAHDLFLEWRKDLERNLRSDALHPALASHFAKYRKLVPTLALINHLADVGSGPVGKEAMIASFGNGDLFGDARPARL